MTMAVIISGLGAKTGLIRPRTGSAIRAAPKPREHCTVAATVMMVRALAISKGLRVFSTTTL